MACSIGARTLTEPEAHNPPGPLAIGSRLGLFIDRTLIEHMEGLELRLGTPELRETVLAFDRPWEGPGSAYCTVFADGDLYRLYYRGYAAAGKPEVTCYAESRDGIRWSRPDLGLFAYEGSRQNNIVWIGPESHNMAPFLDRRPGVLPEERYKALAGEPPLLLVSPDGIHWQKQGDSPVLTGGAFDSQNIAFWDSVRGHYSAYFRSYSEGGRTGVRTIARSCSADLLHWTEPELLDLGDLPPEHLYTSAIVPYYRAPHILLAFPNRFLPDRQVVTENPLPGLSDAVFMSSRDGLHFDRSFMEAFVRPGPGWRNWTDRGNMVAWGLLPTAADELSLYVTRHFRHPSNHLQRATLRVDGFASVHASYKGGELVTVPLLFEGDSLCLNFANSAAGSLRVEIQDREGQALPGFSLAESQPLIGDEIVAIARWECGSRVSALAGRPIQLRFVLQDGDLYSLRFSNEEKRLAAS